ncbi:MAG: hypothetical protein AAB507_01895 [Patescibacteria group bacterium]
MFIKLLKIVKEYIHDKPKIKKVIGIILILVGLAALITPLTPGSWLALIGLELLGIRILFFDPLRRHFSLPRRVKAGEASKFKFWKRK